MQVTPKRNNTIHYLPQEIKETKLTEVTYLPITREMLEQLFSNKAASECYFKCCLSSYLACNKLLNTRGIPFTSFFVKEVANYSCKNQINYRGNTAKEIRTCYPC